MRPIKVGLLGLGTVGSGTANVLSRNVNEIFRRAGRNIIVSHAAAKNFNPEEIDEIEKIEVLDDVFDLVRHPDIDIVVELIGGSTLSKDLVLEAIKHKKHIVTANKALIAMHGNEIFSAANRQGVTVAFEAAVAGGIPIIKALREGLSANHIQWIAGIINGTGNFILSEMREKSRNFDDVLQEAQKLGYAESDPTFDVEGIDAAHKLTILASLAFGIPLQLEACYTEGISNIEPQDVRFAEQFGYRIKHLGIAKKVNQNIELRVHPTMIPSSRLLANVEGVMNAVLINGDAVGPTLYYGAGAGSLPTASAVVADIIDITRNLATQPESRVPHLAFQQNKLSDIQPLGMQEVETAYYLRMTAIDKPGVVASVAGILGKFGISIEAMKQKEPVDNAKEVPLIMLTHQVLEGKMEEAISQIEKLDTINGDITRIRVEHLN